MNMTAIIISNAIGTIALLSVYMNARKKYLDAVPGDKIFLLMIMFNILQCVLEPLSFLVIGRQFAGAHILSLIINFLLFFNCTWFSLLWFIYAELKLYGDIGRIRKYFRYFVIPAALVTVACIVNLFTPVFFTITPDNIYIRTALFPIQYAVAYFYLLSGAVIIYAKRNTIGKYLFLPVTLFLIPTVLGSVLQGMCYGISVMWSFTAIGLSSIYMNIQKETSYIDMLSGIYNRLYAENHLLKEIRQASHDKRIAAVLIDIDKFKLINDKYGHLTGDDAIRNIGRVLRNSVGANGFAARFAGDEFLVVLHVSGEQEVRDTIADISRNMEAFNKNSESPYRVTFSAGYSIYEETDGSLNNFLKRIDAEMYRVKKRKQDNAKGTDRNR